MPSFHSDHVVRVIVGVLIGGARLGYQHLTFQPWLGDFVDGSYRQTLPSTEARRRTAIRPRLPNGKTSIDVRDALITSLGTLPTQLRRSLTWSQGHQGE